MSLNKKIALGLAGLLGLSLCYFWFFSTPLRELPEGLEPLALEPEQALEQGRELAEDANVQKIAAKESPDLSKENEGFVEGLIESADTEAQKKESEANSEKDLPFGSLLNESDEKAEEDVELSDVKEPSKPDPYVEVPAVDSGKFDLLLDSLINDLVLDYPEYYQGVLPKKTNKQKISQILGDNFINISSNISGVRIRFEYPNEIAEDDNRARSFYVDLTFEEEQLLVDRKAIFSGEFRFQEIGALSYSLVVKLSKPKLSKDVAGIRIPVTENKHERVFLQGQDQTSIVIMLPKVKKKGPRGVLICPRDYDFWKVKGGSRLMKNTAYEMVGADFKVRSLVQGRVLTGLGPGFASATIQTSDNILPSQVYYDFSESVHPFVSVEYMQGKNLGLPQAKERNHVTGGVKVNLVLHNSLHQKIDIDGLSRATIKRLELKRSLPIKHSGVQFRAEKGPCVGIIKEVDIAYNLSKEPLANQGEINLGDLAD